MHKTIVLALAICAFTVSAHAVGGSDKLNAEMLRGLNPVENTPQMKALRIELAAVMPTNDVDKIKAVHDKIGSSRFRVGKI